MTKRTKIILLGLFTAGLIGVGVYNYVMHGGARDLTTETTDFAVNSQQIIGEFTKDVNVANKKYLEKAVVVKGKVTSVQGTEVILDNVVNCGFKQAEASINTGQEVTVKGRVVGFDDLMGELKMDQCFIDKKE